MAEIRETGTTVVEDRSGTSLIAVVLVIALLALGLWFAFSVFGDNDNDVQGPTRVENNDNDTTINQPDSQTDGGTTTDGGDTTTDSGGTTTDGGGTGGTTQP